MMEMESIGKAGLTVFFNGKTGIFGRGYVSVRNFHLFMFIFLRAKCGLPALYLLFLVQYLFLRAKKWNYGKYSIENWQMKYFYLSVSLNKFVI
jgi:hypothetical protein